MMFTRVSKMSLVAFVVVAFGMAWGCDSGGSSGGGTTGDDTIAGEDTGPPPRQVSSHSYKGHESDEDSNNFVSVFPDSLGTRLDDCQTCHTGGTFTYEKKGEMVEGFVNSCDFCHLIIHPSEDYVEGQPTTYVETLNPFGADYMASGRSMIALQEIMDQDSDGDGFPNVEEITDLKYPGDPTSKPGQNTAPTVVYSAEDLHAMPAHGQFLLCNSHKQQFDDYALYKGVKAKDILAAAGVDTTSPDFQGITVIAPDGYMKDFTADDINDQYPASQYHAGLGTATLGPDCGFVVYPDTLPEGLVSGGEVPGEQWLTFAWERDGMPMDPSNLDPTSGKISGEGPYRIIVPQSDPGSPDRGSSYSPTECADGWDYDDSKNHNAGDMVRGVMAIRVNPLPEGTEDFDTHNGGWGYIESASLVVYGFGVTAE